MPVRHLPILLLAAAFAVPAWFAAQACDFCGPVNLTLSEEINSAEVAVIATMTKAPEKAKDGKNELTKAVFQVDYVLKGGQHLKQDESGALVPIEAYYFGDAKAKTQFMLMGLDPPKVKWGSPLVLSTKAVEYVRKLPKLPESGAERLEFFQTFLEDADALLARDAYDEFSKAPYSDFRKLRPKLDRAKLLKWIADKELLPSRKRLYFMLLSACGTADDIPMLKEHLTAKPESNEPRLGMEPIMVAYLMLSGNDGMKTIDELFMANKKASYTDIYSAIMALRFLGQEQDRIEKKRILTSFKHMLDRPDYADLVIPDLARWEDWSAMERLVELFKTTKDENAWVRVPVVQYLLACPLPKAKTYIAELEKIDPESVRRANFILPLGRPGGAPKKPAPVPAPEKEKDDAAGGTGAPAKSPAKSKAATPDKAASTQESSTQESSTSGAAEDDGPVADTAATKPSPQQAGVAATWVSSIRPMRWFAAAAVFGVYLVFLRWRFRRQPSR